jgi:cysteine desulfurase
MIERVYLDYAATTPVDPAVLEAMMPYFAERFGNAASSHSFGREAQKVLEDARENLADFIGAQAEEIVFTCGATESNNQAVLGVARRLRSRGDHLVVSKIEHHSVIEPAESLIEEGFRVTWVAPDRNGWIDPQDIEKALTAQTILVAVMHASNEIGTIQPVEAIGKITKARGIPFLVDAVQTVGHIPVKVDELGADLLSLSGHKFYGPKGIGALYIRKGTSVAPFLRGGDQEGGRRASTQNVAGAVGLAKALDLAGERMAEEMVEQSRLRDVLIEEVEARVKGVKVNGHRTQRLANNVHFSFEGVQGEALLMSLDMEGMAASMGSACTAGAMEPSYVLRAIGLTDEQAMGSLRITIGRWTTEQQIRRLCALLPELIVRLRI